MTLPEPDFHCSTFELELHWSSRQPASPRLAAHLAGCVRCRAYLEELDALETQRPEVTWRRPRDPRRWAKLLGAGTAGVAIAAGVALFLRGSGDEADGGYVGAKGSPAVQLLVRRGDAASIWDGHAPVHAGDALALRVACEGLSRVAVAGWGAGESWTRLGEGECPATPATLPFTLVVDGEGDERFAVVISRRTLDDDALTRAARDTARTADVWTVRFDLPKAKEPR